MAGHRRRDSGRRDSVTAGLWPNSSCDDRTSRSSDSISSGLIPIVNAAAACPRIGLGSVCRDVRGTKLPRLEAVRRQPGRSSLEGALRSPGRGMYPRRATSLQPALDRGFYGARNRYLAGDVSMNCRSVDLQGSGQVRCPAALAEQLNGRRLEFIRGHSRFHG